MHIGAVLADKDDPEVLEKLSMYAIPTSIAAQLQDDILGMFGTEKIIGKSALSDIAEGKQTLLILEARKRANDEQTGTLKQLVGKRDITEEEADRVKRVVVDTGALQYVKKMSRRFVDQAQAALETWDADWRGQDTRFFWAVSEAAVSRKY